MVEKKEEANEDDEDDDDDDDDDECDDGRAKRPGVVRWRTSWGGTTDVPSGGGGVAAPRTRDAVARALLFRPIAFLVVAGCDAARSIIPEDMVSISQ